MLYHKEKIEEFIMFYEYQTEIMGVLAILVVSVIYLIVKIKKEKKDTHPKNLEELPSIELPEDKISPINDSYDTETKIIDEYDKQEIEVDGTEEGSFEEIVQEEKIPPKKDTNTNSFQKRDVPPHDKITKENFKEFSGARILVAEDNLINQKVINGLLADSGIEVVIAEDGQVALEILEEDSNFTLILMDAHMPRVDGFEATRAIRANPKYDHIVIIALSGDTAADDIQKMSDAGMSEHLEKPLRMVDLYDMIYAYTGSQNTPKVSQEQTTIMTQELDGEKGLEICGGDKEFYQEILNEFVTTYEDSPQKLQTFLEKEQIQEADKLLLDLMGVTANIGAQPLNEIAGTIKLALNDTQEKSYLSLLKQYKTHLQALIRDIKNYNKVFLST
jgi:CheY-like chemotaxis protein